jgi:hypothetical protein
VVTVVEGEAAYIDLWQSEFGAVAGKVLDPEGRPLRLVVNLFADGSGESMPRVAEPDAEGAYSFRGLAPGRYALVLAGLREEFGLERGERRREDLVVAVGRIEGVVEDGAGRPAGGVAVNYDRLGFADDGWLTGCPEPVRTDAFGRFALTGLCPGRYRLSAEAGEGEGASEVLDLRPGGEVRGVRVVLSPLATLAVLVVGGDGTPRPGAWVAWSQDAAHGGGACDGRGIARFSVRPGRVVLEVRAADGEDRPATRVEADATAPEGPLVRVLVD